MMNDCFTTVAQNVRVKIPVGACRFLASVARTDSEEAARDFIARVCGEFTDATHNAFAYKIGMGDNAVARYSDDGEPAGSAGPPMLQAIESAQLTNVTVVGTRYYGGVKLGIGGLVRAYRACTEAGLAEAGRSREVALSCLTVTVPYELLGTVIRELAACGGDVETVDYHECGVTVTGKIPAAAIDAVRVQMTEATRGKAYINT